MRIRNPRDRVPGVGSGGQLYDRDRLAGAPPPDPDLVAFGSPQDRRAAERAHALAKIGELVDELEDARLRVEAYGQDYVDRLERELVAWRALAGDAGRYQAGDLDVDVPLF
jgi:hypothetical protein